MDNGRSELNMLDTSFSYECNYCNCHCIRGPSLVRKTDCIQTNINLIKRTQNCVKGHDMPFLGT